MIQWYDDRPSEPIAAFIYFETLFRQQFLNLPLSKEKMLNYVWRLSVAKHELYLPILRKWGARPHRSSEEFEDEILYSPEKFEDEIVSIFQKPFDEDLFLRFEEEILSLLPKLKQSLANVQIFREAALAQQKNDLDTTLRLVLRLDRKGDVIAQGLLSYEGRVPENFLRQYTP
jgi:hypothetical protein